MTLASILLFIIGVLMIGFPNTRADLVMGFFFATIGIAGLTFRTLRK